jgi:hypothetical protein
MDVSIVLVRDQNPQDLVDLKANLDVEFEYVGNELTIFELKEIVCCALKCERSCRIVGEESFKWPTS